MYFGTYLLFVRYSQTYTYIIIFRSCCLHEWIERKKRRRRNETELSYWHSIERIVYNFAITSTYTHIVLFARDATANAILPTKRKIQIVPTFGNISQIHSFCTFLRRFFFSYFYYYRSGITLGVCWFMKNHCRSKWVFNLVIDSLLIHTLVHITEKETPDGEQKVRTKKKKKAVETKHSAFLMEGYTICIHNIICYMCHN